MRQRPVKAPQHIHLLLPPDYDAQQVASVLQNYNRATVFGMKKQTIGRVEFKKIDIEPISCLIVLTRGGKLSLKGLHPSALAQTEIFHYPYRSRLSTWEVNDAIIQFDKTVKRFGK